MISNKKKLRRYDYSKKKKHKAKSTSLQLHWFISYFIILLLPLAVSMYYYFYTHNTTVSTIDERQELMLENINEHLEYVMRDFSQLTNTLYLNKNIEKLSKNPLLSTGSAAYARLSLRTELGQLISSNSLLKDIYIYYPLADYIVTTTTTIPAPFLSDLATAVLDYNDILTLLDTLNNNSVVIVNGKNNTLLLATSLFKNKDKQLSSVAIICIDKTYLTRLLENNLSADSTSSYALINKETVLLSIGPDKISDEVPAIWQYHKMNPQSKSFPQDIIYEKEEYLIKYHSSFIWDSILISVTEKNIYYSTIRQMSIILIFTIILCLLLGIGLTAYFSRKNYIPVSRLLFFLGYDNIPARKNEFYLIEEKIKKNLTELEQYRNIQRNNYLEKILIGEIPFNQISPNVFCFSTPWACVVTIKISSNDFKKTFTSDDDELIHFIIQNILSELLTPTFPEHYFCTFSQEKISVLIDMPSSNYNDDNLLLLIKNALNQLMNFSEKHYDIRLLIGISSINNTNNIFLSWNQSICALEFIEIFNLDSLKAFDDIPQNHSLIDHPIGDIAYIQNLLLTGQSKQFDEYFKSLYASIKFQSTSVIDAKSCIYFFYLIATQLCHYCKTNYNFAPTSLDIFHDTTLFSQSLVFSLSSIHDSFNNFMIEFDDYCKNIRAINWGDDICQYIDNNYFDINLNLNSIAEHFSLSPSYLSKKFKNRFGKGVNDYLYEIRISHAKQLLNDPHLKIADIAQLTGFLDSNAFIRIFKKYTGCTPGKYITPSVK